MAIQVVSGFSAPRNKWAFESSSCMISFGIIVGIGLDLSALHSEHRIRIYANGFMRNEHEATYRPKVQMIVR